MEAIKSQTKVDKLETKHFWAYGVGHCLNDLSVSCYLNFLVFFLSRVVKTPAAPYVFLVGQVSDGIAVPVFGILSDKFNTRIGKRTPWYIVGMIITTFTMSAMFVDVESSEAFQYLYYLSCCALYNISWAAMQVSHMSLVPSLTPSRERRDRLSNLRTTFIYTSNFVVLAVGVVLFEIMNNPSLQFLMVAIIVQVIGTCTSIFFLCVIREKKLSIEENVEEEQEQILRQSLISNQEQKSIEKSQEKVESLNEDEGIKMWFKKPLFYLVGICYVGARAFNNCITVLLPFYLVDVLKLGSADTGISFDIALVPLIFYGCGIIVSTQIVRLYQWIGRKKVLGIGMTIGLIGLLGIYVLTPEQAYLVYYFAVFVGSASGLMLSTAINLISQVVGDKGKQGAFVYGLYSFLDQSLVGLVVYMVTHTESYSKTSGFTDADESFVRLTMVLIPALACIIGVLSIMFYPIPGYSANKNEVDIQKVSQSTRESID